MGGHDMGALGTKLRTLEGGRVAFWCPGCDEAHQVRVDPAYGSVWGFNGDGDAPTFTPSILVNGKRRITDAEHARLMSGETVDVPDTTCHSFVTNGQIQFLGDCSHALSGQTVSLGDFDT